MKAFGHLWQYLAEVVIEVEMFQTKVVEKVKTHILRSVTFSPENRAVFETAGNLVTAGLATDGKIIRLLRFACWITKATNKY